MDSREERHGFEPGLSLNRSSALSIRGYLALKKAPDWVSRGECPGEAERDRSAHDRKRPRPGSCTCAVLPALTRLGFARHGLRGVKIRAYPDTVNPWDRRNYLFSNVFTRHWTSASNTPYSSS